MTVTEDDCFKALKSKIGHGDFIVERFSFDLHAESLGFLSNQGTLNVTVRLGSTTEEHRFFVKLFSGFSPKFTEGFVNRFGFASKELDIVQKLIPEFEDAATKKVTAKCFYGMSHRFMILEHLSDFGLEMIRSPEVDLNHARVSIEAIAHFHSLSFIKERQLNESLGEKYKDFLFEALFGVLDDDPKLGYLYAGGQRLASFIKEFFEEFPDADRYADRVKQELTRLIKPSTQFKNIICHGDCWKHNFLFKYDANNFPQDAMLIDFQIARFTPPAHDLVYFMRMNFPQEFRQIHEKQLLAHYFQTLTKYLDRRGINIEDAFPASEFWTSYEYFDNKYGPLVLFFAFLPEIPQKYLHMLFGDDESRYETMAKGNVSVLLEVFKLAPEFKNEMKNRVLNVIKHHKFH